MFRSSILKTALLLLILVCSCRNENKVSEEVSQIEINLAVERFDRAFAKAGPKDISGLKTDFPFLFSERMPDSLIVSRMKDTLQHQLLREVDEEFGDFNETKREIKRLFRYLKYYDKSFSVPKVITLTNDVDYRYPVIVTDTLVLVALDNYLGGDHKFYANISDYIKLNMSKNQVVVDLAQEYAKNRIFPNKMKNFLEEMIYFGKVLYFKEKVIPFKTDAEKIGYSKEQLEFARLNEEMIWTHFVENEMLFDDDNSLVSRFIADAPFSKFYLGIDNETPGRLGQFIGWQIVRAYMENNDLGLLDMMKTEPSKIFNESNYKPAK